MTEKGKIELSEAETLAKKILEKRKVEKEIQWEISFDEALKAESEFHEKLKCLGYKADVRFFEDEELSENELQELSGNRDKKFPVRLSRNEGIHVYVHRNY